VKPSSILWLYRARLRTGLVRELLAVLGIAVGVSLLFASQVASNSLNGSVEQLTSGIVGQMRYQLIARSPQGFDQRLLTEARELPGVQAAAPVLEQRSEAFGPRGQESVDFIGTEPRFARLGGQALRHIKASALAKLNAVALPHYVAHSLGLTSLQPVTLQLGANRRQALIGLELFASESQALADSPVVIAPLAYAQRLTGMKGRLTRVFVQPRAGHGEEILSGLERIAAGRVNVRSADFDATVFKQAAAPTNQSTSLFSTLSALVGFLFAFNAMLLTVGYRKDFVYDLRLDGYTRRQVVGILLFDALVLGVLGSIVGLVLGDFLSLDAFRADPGYLSFAFPIGSQRIVSWQSAGLAFGGGLLAACVGVLAPLRQIFAPFSLAQGERHEREGRGSRTWRLLGGLACLTATIAILVEAPQSAIVGMALLSLALLLMLPTLLDAVVIVFDHMHGAFRGASPYLAVIELQDRANRSRSLAVAATGAIAVFASVAIQGAHSDLVHGLDGASRDVNATADLWISPSGNSNLLATTPFHATDRAKLEHLPGVQAVRLYRGGFLDIGDRRVWVIAPPRDTLKPLPESQLEEQDIPLATARFRQGGWAILSHAVARQLHVRVGSSFTLPSPDPMSFRVAALSTNVGWSPGAIVLNADDYARAWGSNEPSAYSLIVAPGSLQSVREEARRALDPNTGLVVESAAQRETRGHETSRQGLSQLSQIARLVLIAALLAMAAAMGAMIWQRRPQLAAMKVDGYGQRLLWRSLVLESLLLLGTGCSIGACFGLLGQVLLSHALAAVTGFPVIESLSGLTAILSVMLVTSVAVAITAVPGYLAAGVRPAAGLQE
jgi:putative ABC transport system permease protein